VVEDDQSYQILIREAFRAVGVQSPLQFASSGSEAIAYLMGNGKFSDRNAYAYPTFIITDLNMPQEMASRSSNTSKEIKTGTLFPKWFSPVPQTLTISKKHTGLVPVATI
jgi:CheY-like chemotaxis protein